MKFKAKNGEEFEIRKLKESDLESCLKFINGLVEEGANILYNKKITLEEEQEWLNKQLAAEKRGEVVFRVVEKDGEIVANSGVHKGVGNQSHMGIFGISVREGYRRLGIATKLAETVLEAAPKLGIDIIRLTVFSGNTDAIGLYKKLGFVEEATIPNEYKTGDVYSDGIVMSYYLQEEPRT